MFWVGDMMAASAVMERRVIWPPFLRSTIVTCEGSTQTIQLSDDIVVRPCLIAVSGTPNAARLRASLKTIGTFAAMIIDATVLGGFYYDLIEIGRAHV